MEAKHILKNFIMSELEEDEMSSNSESSSDNESDDQQEEEIICAAILSDVKDKRNCVKMYVMKTIPSYSNEEFRIHFRVSREIFEFLVDKFEVSDIYKSLDVTKAYSSHTHMTLFLWFAGHEACSFRDIADRFNVSLSTASVMITRVTYFISGLSSTYIRWPTAEDMQCSSTYFEIRKGFKGAIGAIDGTHIRIMPPTTGKDEYINRKGDVTLHMQAICDHRAKFIDVFIGYPGSVHDNRVFENSDIFEQLPSLCGDHYILGDSAYACSDHVITPFRDNGHLNAKQKFFNQSLSSCRVVIEHGFGKLKQRFRQLYFCKLKGNKKLCHFIRACVVLHNLCNDDWLNADADETQQLNSNCNENSVETIKSRSTRKRSELCEIIYNKHN